MRLTEIAANVGTPGHLLDDASQIDAAWFTTGPETRVLVTAGASAPEDLVAGVVKTLLERFGGELEQWDVVEEDLEFALPGNLRKIMRSRGIDPSERRIIITRPEPTLSEYGAVALTVSAASAPPEPNI